MHLWLVCALLSVSPAPTPEAPAGDVPPARDYVQEINDALIGGVGPWTVAEGPRLRRLPKEGGIAALEIGVAADGSVPSLRLSLTSGKPDVDDALRRFVLAVEPLPAPPPELLGERREMPCLLRLVLGKKGPKPTVLASATCERTDGSLLPVLSAADLATAADPAALLMSGYVAQGTGDANAAMEKLRAAVTAAPNWPWAARALGLGLVATKKAGEAIPFLRVYVAARGAPTDVSSYAREIARFDQLRAAREAEANRVRDRLSKQDIVGGVRKGYPLLEPCLKAARGNRLLVVGVDTLTFTFRIRKDGTPDAARLEGPGSLLMSEHAECLERALSAWKFPRYSAGSDITINHLPIRVRGSTPSEAVAAASGAALPAAGGANSSAPAAEALADEPVFSQCERSAGEVDSFVRGRFDRIQACVLSERRRAPKAPMPDSLPIAFVVDSDGSVRNVSVNHRYFREGPLSQCIAAALAASLEAVDGADCPAELNLDLRGLP